MDEGGRGECQKEGRNGPVGRVAMSGPGRIHGVPRWVCWPARPQAVGVFRCADGQMGGKVGWVGRGLPSQAKRSDPGRAS